MTDAGYGQYADSTPYPVRANRGLAFAQPYGPWGYIGPAGVRDGDDLPALLRTASATLQLPGPRRTVGAPASRS